MRLTTEKLSVQFSDIPALREVSFDLPSNSMALLLGPASSGKTTLLKTLTGLRRPDGGRVLWDGEDAALIQGPQRAAQQARLGLAFQTDALFDSMTVLENVELPLLKRRVPKAEARKRSIETIERVGLGHALNVSPERLSGGMKKRAGVARAIVAEPEVILCDDPLAGLDPATSVQLCELFLSISRGKSLLICAPEPLPTLPIHRWLFLSEGRLVHDGPPDERLLELEHFEAAAR